MYGYAGRSYDLETRNIITESRIYDAMSKDPLGLVGDTNLYQYASNNPLSFTDPTGLWGRLAELFR
jgi:RHS repeat-associated protein